MKTLSKFLKLKSCCAVLAVTALSACSPANFWSANAGLGALGGTAIGAGIGGIIGQEHGNMTANVLANGALGALGGLAAGGIYNAMLPADESQNGIVERRAVMVNENQHEIDELRQQVDDSGRWGRAEEKPWEERYLGNNPNEPYQGPGIQYDRYIQSN